ncbi:MAG TPA: host-nuclease inhibitor Gam family protein [Tepidisphaeraceae bacterium]|nr:host-nuclease inhibitor Gam family protein [Tepidisphaeraceae bacterium]
MSEINSMSQQDSEHSIAAADDDQWKDPEVAEEFAVHDDNTANWVIRKIVEARAYAARCGEWCRREQLRARKTEEFFLHRYGGQLAAWARERIAQQGSRRKSLSLPAGTAGFRAEPARLVVEDESAVIGWAKSHCPDLVRISEDLSKSALNDHIRKTGELPDQGVRLEPEHERFYVK